MMIIVGFWFKDNVRNLEILDWFLFGYLRCLLSEGGLVWMGMFYYLNVNLVDIIYLVVLFLKYNFVLWDVVWVYFDLIYIMGGKFVLCIE